MFFFPWVVSGIQVLNKCPLCISQSHSLTKYSGGQGRTVKYITNINLLNNPLLKLLNAFSLLLLCSSIVIFIKLQFSRWHCNSALYVHQSEEYMTVTKLFTLAKLPCYDSKWWILCYHNIRQVWQHKINWVRCVLGANILLSSWKTPLISHTSIK